MNRTRKASNGQVPVTNVPRPSTTKFLAALLLIESIMGLAGCSRIPNNVPQLHNRNQGIVVPKESETSTAGARVVSQRSFLAEGNKYTKLSAPGTEITGIKITTENGTARMSFVLRNISKHSLNVESVSASIGNLQFTEEIRYSLKPGSGIGITIPLHDSVSSIEAFGIAVYCTSNGRKILVQADCTTREDTKSREYGRSAAETARRIGLGVELLPSAIDRPGDWEPWLHNGKGPAKVSELGVWNKGPVYPAKVKGTPQATMGLTTIPQQRRELRLTVENTTDKVMVIRKIVVKSELSGEVVIRPKAKEPMVLQPGEKLELKEPLKPVPVMASSEEFRFTVVTNLGTTTGSAGTIY